MQLGGELNMITLRNDALQSYMTLPMTLSVLDMIIADLENSLYVFSQSEKS